MLNLIIKDILIQKKTFFYALAFYPIFIIFALQGMPEGMFTMGSFFISYMLIFGAFAYDERSRADLFVLSLPVKKREVVAARYLSFILFALLGCLVMTLYIYIAKTLNMDINLGTISFSKILTNLMTIAIIFSIYMPIMFKFGSSKTKVIGTFVFAFLGVSLSAIANYLNTEKNIDLIRNMPQWLAIIAPILIILISLYISLRVSARIYSTREF